MKKPSLPTNMVAVPFDARKGFEYLAPGGRSITCKMSWADWAEYHKELGQALAKRMREYGGPAEQDDPPPGGTPVLMRQAA